MNKNLIIASLLLFLIVLTGMFIVQKREVFQRLPYQTEYEFEDVTTAIVDENKNIIFIDNNKQRIVKLNTASTVQFELTDNSKNNKYAFHNLFVDQRGMIYVHKIEYEPYSENIQAEKIVRYTADGEFDKEVFSIPIDETDRTRHERKIKSLHLLNDEMLLVMQLGQNISLQSINVSTYDVTVLVDKRMPPDLYVHEIAGVANEAILFSTKSGDIYQLVNDSIELLSGGNEQEIGRGVPELFVVGSRDDAYFLNTHKREIVRMNVNNGKEQVFLKESDIQSQGHSVSLTNLQSLKVNEGGYFAISQLDRIVVFDRHGLVEGIYERGYFEQNQIFYHWFIWILPIALFLLLIFSISFIYVKVMNKKVSLMIKFATLYLITMALAIGGISLTVYKDVENDLSNQLFAEINNASEALKGAIDGDIVSNLSTPKQYMSNDYANLISLSDIPSYDMSIYKYEHGKLYTLVSNHESMFTPHELTDVERRILRGETITENEANERFVYRPIFNSSNDLVGLLKIVGNEQYIDNEMKQWFDTYIQRLMIICSIVTLLFIVISIYFIFPVRTLTKGVQEIAKGNWETAISLHRLDELGILSQQIERMTDYVKNHIDKITALNNSYYRFVPQQFLQFLGKETLLDVQLGDHTEQEKTILVFKMRSFFTFSRSLSPEENFKFINSFLKRFSPIIREHNGMINKYLGPGGLSLFSSNAKDAVISAIAMRHTLYEYNLHRKKLRYELIDIGIAIHKGPIMLGIIGGKDRLESAVISDDVNLTEVLERLSETLDVAIVATQSVIEDIKGDGQILYRSLGIVNVGERDEPIQLYDIYHGDEENIRRLKEDTKQLFEHGIYLYQEGRFFDARSTFINVIKRNPYDKVAKLYFYLCDEYFQKGTPKDWNGNLIVEDAEQVNLHEQLL